MSEEKKYPNSWEVVTLSDVFIDPKNQIVDGPFGSNLKASEYKEAGVPVLRIQNIDRNNFIDKNIKYVTEEKAEFLSRHSFIAGDFIITKLGAPLGKTCFVPRKYQKGIIVADLVRGRITHDNVDKRFLVHQINSYEVIKQFKKHTKGTTRPRVNLGIIRGLEIVVPPLNEQHRIVEKIEELFSELDNGIANLTLAQQQLKVYRQALLKAAFEGKLTEEWRKQNNPEPAEKLLARIKTERQARYERDIEEWKAAVKEWKKEGNEGKKPRKPTSLVEMEKLSFDDLSSYNIPSTWTWCRNNELIYYVTSGSRDWKKFYSDQGAYFIRTQDIKSNKIKLKEAAYVDLPDNVEGKRSLVEKGDLLMTITGANVGKIAYIKDEINEAYVSQSVALMKPVDIKLSPYLHFYFQSVAYGAGLIDNLVYGVGRPVLSLENMREAPVALPSIEEQVEIINELESGFSIIDNLEEAITISLKQGEILKHSILKKAFEGKLVTQDPNDESASILLERIKREKAKHLAEQKKRKKKSPKKIRKMSKELSIEDVLKAAKNPMQAKDVWLKSKHKGDIEEFYAELKKIQDQVKEVKKGTDSLLSLVK